jgi:hypothetical protein
VRVKLRGGELELAKEETRDATFPISVLMLGAGR